MSLPKFNWRIIVGVLAIVLFGFRIIVSIKERENRKEQLRVMQELSRKQREESWGHNNADSILKQSLELNIQETLKSLDSTKNNLDEIGRRLDSLK